MRSLQGVGIGRGQARRCCWVLVQGLLILFPRGLQFTRRPKQRPIGRTRRIIIILQRIVKMGIVVQGTSHCRRMVLVVVVVVGRTGWWLKVHRFLGGLRGSSVVALCANG